MERTEFRRTRPASAVADLPEGNIRRRRRPINRIDILIAYREAVFRLGLRRLLREEESLRVLGEAGDETQAVHLARQLKPGLVFIQAEMVAQAKDPELPIRLHHASSGCKVVVTAASLDHREHLRFVKAGASGVILKSAAPELFVKCAQKVMSGEIWLAKQQVAELAQQLGTTPVTLPRPVDTLTQREKTIVSYLVQGWRNREIAERLEISHQTVKNHLRAVYDKVGVSDRLELTLFVLHQRLDLPSTSLEAVNQN